MNNTCYTVIIRQKICQSGVPLLIENTYTNLSNTQNILLRNGYYVSISEGPSGSGLANFTNAQFNINFSTTIPNNEFAIFDLPIPSGTFRVGIYISQTCCCTCE